MSYSELFYLITAGQGRWLVHHQITDEPAGSVMLTNKGFILRDDESRLIGRFPSIDAALRGLYALV